MVTIRKLFETIVQDLDSSIYPVNYNNKAERNKPKYPFGTYNILNAKTNVTEAGIVETSKDNSSLTIQPQMILSINAYAETDYEALELIRKYYHYFKYQNDLENINVTVVDVLDVQDRTVLITDHFEYRYGFDVFIRYVDKIDKKIYNIEEWSVNYD